MTVNNIFERATWTGTNAERSAFTPDVTGTMWFCTDTGLMWWWDGSQWVCVSSGIKEIVFSSSGNCAVAGGVTRCYNTMGITFYVSKILIAVNTAPTGAAIIVDVNKNGVSILNPANRPQIAAGAYVGETTTIATENWDDDDYFTVDVDQIGSGTPGAELVVHITIMPVT